MAKSSMKKWFRTDDEATVAPDELRAMREGAGWTPERMADEMGVLPLEVTAWESGASAADLRRAALIRWHIDQAEYQARLPRSHCYWSRANEARLERMRAGGLVNAVRASDEVAAHARECAECMHVEMLRRDLPAAPEPPAEPGFRGWTGAVRNRIRQLPLWLRLPLQAADFALNLGAVYVALLLVSRIQGEDPPCRSRERS